MYTIKLLSIVAILFFVNIVQAATGWMPPAKYLPPEQLDKLLQKWDQLAHSDDLWDRSGALLLVLDEIPRGERFSRSYFCAFDNPEIIDRVVALFLEEVARVQSGEFDRPEIANTDHGGAEDLMALAEVAESTFDPRLYDDMLHINLEFSQGLRNFYLATVNPERTLDYLFNRKLNQTGFEGQVRRSFVILSYMTVESPQALRADRERAITFIAKHARYFAKMVLHGHDYYVRSDALDVLELVGSVTDVPLVKEIIHDAKEVDLRKIRGGFRRTLDKYLDHGYERIRDKGQRIIEELRRRSPSQR